MKYYHIKLHIQAGEHVKKKDFVVLASMPEVAYELCVEAEAHSDIHHDGQQLVINRTYMESDDYFHYQLEKVTQIDQDDFEVMSKYITTVQEPTSVYNEFMQKLKKADAVEVDDQTFRDFNLNEAELDVGRYQFTIEDLKSVELSTTDTIDYILRLNGEPMYINLYSLQKI